MNIMQMSVSASLLIIAIVVTRAVALNRLPKVAFLLLWGIVLCRLLVPFSVPSQFSIANVLAPLYVNEQVPTAMPSPMQAPIENFVSTNTVEAVQTREVVQPVAQRVLFTVEPMTLIWLIGMSLALALLIAAHTRSRRALGCALPYDNNPFLKRWLAEHRTHRPISILYSDQITTPLTIGLMKPRIILPKNMNLRDSQLMNYVLTHEYYHIKRMDALWKMLMAIAVCVHWFNPLVWVMCVLMNRDLELTCDELVVRRFGAMTKKEYAYSLIGLAEQRGKFAPLYSSFSKNAVEERITAIMKIKKSSIVSILVACALLASMTTVFATSEASTKVESITSEVPNDLAGVAMEATESTAFIGGVDGPRDISVATTNAIVEETPNGASGGNINDYSEYSVFGIRLDDGKLYYHEKPVRAFIDEYTFEGNTYSKNDYYSQTGAVDVRTIRDRSIDVFNPDGSRNPGGTVVQLEITERVALNDGEALLDIPVKNDDVREIINEPTNMTQVQSEDDESRIELESVESIAFDLIEGEQETITATTVDVDLTGVTGLSLAEHIAPYNALGLTFVAVEGANGAGNLYFEGRRVRTFTDIKPDGSAFSCSSVDGGDIVVRTVYNANGQLLGVKTE